MSLNIKDAETDRLARELARETGESITVAAKIAFEERLTRVRRQREAATDVDLIAIVHRGRARPTLDDRASEEILGYDDIGLPRSMVVDSSALVAIVLGEPEAEGLLGAMSSAQEPVHVSAVSLVETSIVLEARQGPDATRDLGLLLDGVGAEVAAVDREQAQLAFAAWKRFGKGRHLAGLNLGDCFSYALAKSIGHPLLFKGGDFSQTDIGIA